MSVEEKAEFNILKHKKLKWDSKLLQPEKNTKREQMH